MVKEDINTTNMKQLVILNNKMWSKEIVGEIKLTSFFTKTDVTEQDKESGMVRTLFHAIVKCP